MAKQSAKDRARRAHEGCCPIHGLPMPQVGNDLVDGQHVYIVECPRKDCQVRASKVHPDGEAVLLPAYADLIGPTSVD